MDPQRGSLYKVGPHTVLCGDLEKGDAHLLLDRLPSPPTMAWCDPPYDQRVAARFRRDAGLRDEPVLVDILDGVAAALARVGGPCYVEMGKNGLEAMRQALLWHSPRSLDVQGDLTYDGGKTTLYVFHVAWDHGMVAPRPTPGSDGWRPAHDVMSQMPPGQLVFDPCMGVAGFGKVALRHHHAYCGMELQPRRVLRALATLSRMSGWPVTAVGNIINE